MLPPWSFWGPRASLSSCRTWLSPDTTPHPEVGTADRLITPFAVTQRPALPCRQPVCHQLIRAIQGCLPSPPAMHNSSASLFPVAIFPCLPPSFRQLSPLPLRALRTQKLLAYWEGCLVRKHLYTRMEGVGGGPVLILNETSVHQGEASPHTPAPFPAPPCPRGLLPYHPSWKLRKSAGQPQQAGRRLG